MEKGEKDGFGGRSHLQAGEDMRDDSCPLPFGEKSREYICSRSHKYLFGISQIHFWDLKNTFFWISQIHFWDLTNTFSWDLTNRMQSEAGAASCIGGENNPDSFELWNTPFESSGHM